MRYSGILIEHEADHGEKYPSASGVCRPFIIPNKPTVINEPSESALNNPASRQNIETWFIGDASDDFNYTSWAFASHPAGKFRTTETAIGPDFSEFELVEHGREQFLGSTAFGSVSRKNGNAQNPAKNVDANEAFAALGLFSRIIANWASMRARAYSLAVNYASTGRFAPADKAPQNLAQAGIDGFQQVRAAPGAKVVVNRFPSRKILWHHPPRTTTFQNIKNTIKHSSQTGPWATSPARRRKQGRYDMPLEVSNAGFVLRNFHRSNSAAR